MKKLVVFILIAICLFGCKKNVLPKPDHLIEKDKMEEILYELAVLDALKAQNLPNQNLPSNMQYIKNQHNIDSITFAKSAQYYASDIREYKKMYENVKNKIDEDKKAILAK